jgi:hypothetical protein
MNAHSLLTPTYLVLTEHRLSTPKPYVELKRVRVAKGRISLDAPLAAGATAVDHGEAEFDRERASLKSLISTGLVLLL